jgi:hypothetical protein
MHIEPSRCPGRHEGTERFLGRKGLSRRLLAIAIALETEPPDVCGADTSRLPCYTDMTSEHTVRW